MKILALGDPHGTLPKNLDKIISKNEIELIVCVGDIGFVPKKPWLQEEWDKAGNIDEKYEKYIDKIASYNLPVLTLRGDTYIEGGKKIADRILKKHKNVINKFTGEHKLNGQNFIFFDISFELETIKPQNQRKFFIDKMRRNKNRESRLKKMLRENKNSIIISHNPPYGVVDKIFNGKHVGSKILLNAIKMYSPKLVLCGHIHEARGKAKIGQTLVYNLGCRGDYAVVDTHKNKLLESNFLK
jgi:uncharacterized protein